MAFYDTALTTLTSDPLTAGVLIGAGFIISHLLHALVYGLASYGSIFEKIKRFFKALLFYYK